MLMVLIGVLLVLAGTGGAMNACLTAGPEDSDLVLSVVSGLAFATGIVLIALGGARHGYHYRPLGAPPGDADPDKVDSPGT